MSFIFPLISCVWVKILEIILDNMHLVILYKARQLSIWKSSTSCFEIIIIYSLLFSFLLSWNWKVYSDFFENKTILIIGATGSLAKGYLPLPALPKCIYICLFIATNINNLSSKLFVYILLDSTRLCVYECIYIVLCLCYALFIILCMRALKGCWC